MKNTNIGFIGLGEMGTPMAANLLKNHFDLVICGHSNRNHIEVLKSLHAVEVGSPREVAASADIIIVMVRDIPQTDEVVLGQGYWDNRGLFQGAKSGSIILLCSTLEPNYCRKLADKAKEKGVFILDSPVSGGFPSAQAGTLTFMVGGDKAAFERCLPVLKGMGKSIYYLGESGLGQAMKLINNYMMVVTAFGSSEAIAMGLKFGLGLDQMMEVIKVSSGNSAVIDRWKILAQHQKDFDDSQSGKLSIFKKDTALAVDFANEIGLKADFGRLALVSSESALFPTGPSDDVS
jgi:3-hydroxyisobutyrate dehydrogenase-like beta-hydroxyacid dehydrogenase